MRSTNDQLKEIIKRSDTIRDKARLKRYMLTEMMVSIFCVVLIITSVFYMPDDSAAAGEITSHYGSLILSNKNMGVIVVGLLAFLLGVTVTLLCTHYREYRSRKSQGEHRR